MFGSLSALHLLLPAERSIVVRELIIGPENYNSWNIRRRLWKKILL